MHRIPLRAAVATALLTGCSLFGVDNDRDGYTEDEDCDDNNAQIRPGINEVCDGLDNDCDGQIDDGVLVDFYRDADGDGYGDPTFAVQECEEPGGFSGDGGDCDDSDDAVHPEADEVCDGVDNDCDGDVDEEGALEELTWYRDSDGDGFGDDAEPLEACTQPDDHTAEGSDCDDTDATIHPDADELCNDVDDDCDGATDEEPVEGEWVYKDNDYDGYGDPETGQYICEMDLGYSTDDTDCDDSSGAVYPGADEHCNGEDDDCDGVVDDDPVDGLIYFEDADGDGHGNPDVFDHTCDPPAGWVTDGFDCDDTTVDVHPGAAEVCDGVDNDCDAGNDEALDHDGDGYSLCDGDCDDTDLSISPFGLEICDGLDNDCSGYADDGCIACTTEVPDDHATIQNAIDASISGDVICVDEGTYTETVDFNGRDVEVLGLAGPEWTVIDAAHTGSVVTFASGEGVGAVLQGFSLVNGAADDGAGVLVDGAAPTLRELVVRDCQANTHGGGVAVFDGTLSLSDSVVSANYAFTGRGGGIYVEASNAVISGLEVQFNSAGDGGGGLAAHAADGAVEIADSAFLSNSAYLAGGGIYVTDTALLTRLQNVWVSGNVAGSPGGGGVALVDAYGMLEVVEVVANDAPSAGGLYVSGGQTLLDNVRVQGNTGGGVELRSSNTPPVLTHVSIVGNESTGPGAGVLLVDLTPTFVNTDISENSGPAGGGVTAINAAPLFRHCNVWGNDPVNYVGTPDVTGLDGNLSTDPGYLDSSPAEPAGWDLHLWSGSSLADAGDPSYLDPDGSTADVGAFGGTYADLWDLDRDGYPLWWQPGDYDYGVYPGQGWDCDDDDPETFPGQGC